MARDAVAIVQPDLNDSAAIGAGTTITPANGAAIAADGVTGDLVIRVTQTGATAKSLTVVAGANPPGLTAGLGDLAIGPLAQNSDVVIRVESARFCQANGDINIDFETGFAGKIWALRAS